MSNPKRPERERTRAAGEEPPGVPRWVKVFGLVVVIMLLVLLVAMLAGGSHGPGRHQSGGTGPHGDSEALASAEPQSEGLADW
jgi:hypothetical protein